jgi:predicted membrane channel-forming protein YqfA (hemolysin III family)
LVAFLPPLFFVLAWVFALIGWSAPGADASTPFDEQALRWILFLAVGWTGVGGSISHTIFARQTAKSIGWETNGFQYEVGFANLALGLAGIYASSQDASSAWIAASLAGGVFLVLAGANHVLEIVRDRNYAPGNTAILLSDFGTPISLLALLIATGAI